MPCPRWVPREWLRLVSTIAHPPFYNANSVAYAHVHVQPGYGLHLKMTLRPV